MFLLLAAEISASPNETSKANFILLGPLPSTDARNRRTELFYETRYITTMHGANDVVHLSSFQVASYDGAMQLRNQRNDIEALELVP